MPKIPGKKKASEKAWLINKTRLSDSSQYFMISALALK